MKKVLTIGGAMYDIFIQLDTAQTLKTLNNHQCLVLSDGKKMEVDQVTYHTGGGATNAATLFSLCDFATTVFCKVGTDDAGEFIINSLNGRGINTSAILKTPILPTGTSFIMPNPSGNRTALVYRGANMTLQEQELPYELLSQAPLIYITSLSGQTAQFLPIITNVARPTAELIAVNPGTSQLTTHVQTLIEALPFIDVLILNTHEATLLMNNLSKATQASSQSFSSEDTLPELLRSHSATSTSFSLTQFFTTINQLGPHTVVVTNGKEGVYAFNNNTIYFHPSIAEKVVSTLGAGDAFGSTFTAFLAKGKSIEDALRAGSINSAAVLQHMGTTTGLLTYKQLVTLVGQLDNKKLQKFDV